MNFASRCGLIALALTVLSTLTFAADAPPASQPAAAPAGRPLIQLALLLDTSNSMDGLIDQARSQLWTVVNHLARTKKDGQTPRLEVALYEYGNQGLKPQDGFIRQVLPFTDDLDSVSEKLFALRTNGGDEFCGQVIQTAVNDLKWSPKPDVYKTAFIAGNEPFTQGTVDYHGACEAAAKLGIIVNTVHCGSPADGVSGQWDQGARIGGGKFLCINQDKVIIAVATPQDEQITKLSSELNKTYVPFGVAGVPAQQRQAQQDLAAAAPAAASAGAPVARAVAKSNALYSNANWDLVDAVNQKNVKLEDVKEADLPEPMRKMTPEQRKAYVEEQAKQRADLQKQINSLNADREKFIADKRKEAGKADTLDAAMLGAVDEQLKGKQFEEAK